MAQSAPFCGDAQSVDWLDAFAPLTEQLGGVMGEPIECAHQRSDAGDTAQAASTGLAILRSPSGLVTFTAGQTHGVLTADQGLLSWMGTNLDPPRREIPCRALPIRGFGQVFGTMDEAFGLIGCPWSAETGVDVATQRFEHGWMIWRASRDTWDPGTIFVLFEDDQHYVRFDDTYSPTADPASCNNSPPPGPYQP